MIRLPRMLALLLVALICAGCAKESDLDLEVQGAVERFWQSMIKPDFVSNGGPLLKNAYEQLRPDAKGQQTHEAFREHWIEWVQERAPGWILGAEIESAEKTPDSATVVVRLSLGHPTGLEPVSSGDESLVSMILRKEGAAWAE